MKWFLEEKIEPSPEKINHGDIVLFLGSCFSENILQKGRQAGFNFINSRYGTVFHPIPMVRILQNALNDNPDSQIFFSNDRYYSWDASTKWTSLNLKTMEDEIQKERQSIRRNLIKAKFLFLTFGTAKEYANKEGLIVSNCHKQPSSDFTVRLTSVETLVQAYTELIQQLLELNPALQIVLTVSPVRHSKDGLVNNNRSKGRLLLMCEELTKLNQVSYFPAYEMLMDELRDYRFYSADKVHPSDEAVEYVWEKFNERYFSQQTILLAGETVKKRQFFNHHILRDLTEREETIYATKESDLKDFLAKYPQIVW